MTERTDLTRWNRAGLSRFRYVDANAPVFLESLRDALARRFGNGGELWGILHAVPSTEDLRERLRRIESQYGAERRDMGWEILRLFARACHVLVGHVDAYANEGFLGTATQWEHVRRLVEMLDYHPAPPASAFTSVALVAKAGAAGLVTKGLQMKYAPPGGPAATFETLGDIVVDAALNELRPAGYGRSTDPLTGSVLTFDDTIKHLRAGEPVVLEDERSGVLRAYVIQGVRERDNRTEVTVRPPLWRGFLAGHTVVHAQPLDRVAPKGPAVAQTPTAGVLHLVDPPGDLQPGEIVCIRDSQHQYFRRVGAVRGRILVFDEPPLGPINLAYATVARAQLVSVNRLTERKIEQGAEIRVIRVAGDYGRVAGATIADLCIGDSKQTTIAEYSVMNAAFIPGEQKDPNAGYTLLHVVVTNQRCKLANPQSLWLPPVGSGWAVDRVLEKRSGQLRPAILTGKPKKAAPGDVAAIMRGNQIAWSQLSAVAVDAAANEATLTTQRGWQDRGGADFFLADTWVYAHFKQPLRVAGWQINRTPLPGARVPLDGVPAPLRIGKPLLVESAGSAPVLAAVLDVDDHGVVLLSRALPAGATVDSVVLRGNIVRAGHGEAQSDRVLGTGSASQSNQVFVLQVDDISFIPDSTQATGVRADIAVRVDGAEWKQVSTLNDSGPADTHYVVRMTEDAYLLIGFGDGTNGRRLPSGTNNVRIAFREGNGLAGNIPAGSLKEPAKPHALVGAVRQLTPAIGGNDMENVASLRENAPASLLALERAVSLSDFGFLAGTHSSVWQARAFARPSQFEQREQIEVVVVPANGSDLGELGATLKEFLLRHGVPGVAIAVTQYHKVCFRVDVDLSVDEAAYTADDVRTAVERALIHAFGLARRRLGQDVFLSEIYKVVENVVGVVHSKIVLNGDKDLRRLPTDETSINVLGTYTVTVLRETVGAPSTPGGALPPEEPAPAPSGPAMAIGGRSSIVIDGVGPIYAQRLAAAGRGTVQSVAAMDPEQVAVDMPRSKIWEAIAKAQLLLEVDLDVALADAVLDRPLADIAEMSPAALGALTRARAARVTQLRGLVRRLQVSLDAAAFATLTLREFAPR
jgi:predicted phage baseplate assembly protein